MRRLLNGAGLVLMAIPIVGIACGDSAVLSTTKRDGTKVGLVITSEQIDNGIKWNPEQGEPPLSISQVHRKVQDWAKTEYSRYDRVEIREIALTKLGCSLVEDYWYYRADLIPIFDGNQMWGSGNWAAVLMDGTVIGTTEVP